MAMTGPPPKPTRLKVIEGNRGKKKLNTKEPKPLPITPKRPSWMDGTAKRFWGKYVPILTRLGIFTEIDGEALAVLAQTFSEYRDCVKLIKAEGRTFTTEKGYVIQRPEVSILRKARKDVESLLAHFGMTPAARSRLSVELPGDDDEFEDLLD